jgi:hypothetical protein
MAGQGHTYAGVQKPKLDCHSRRICPRKHEKLDGGVMLSTQVDFQNCDSGGMVGKIH